MKYLQFLIIFLIFNNFKAQEYNDPIPVHDTFIIDSKEVKEIRTINVWTPPEYTQSLDSLPVLYMPDGGVKEDFAHVANTMAKLIKSREIKPFILVGIENTQRRRDLTGFTTVAIDKKIAPIVGGSENFRAFINNELFSEINKRYRTTADRGILGESLAGLFITETLVTKPEMFKYYIAFDPSLWWNDDYLVKNTNTLFSKPLTSEKRFWFASSGTKEIYKPVHRFEKILGSMKITNLTWKLSDEPKEDHNTIFRANIEKALIWTLNN